MESPQRLFRSTALAAQRSDTCGEIVLSQPIAFTTLSGALALMGSGLVALLVFGSYTAHSTLRGQVVPTAGIIDIRSPQPGTVVGKKVVEGQRVEAGDALYVVSGERLSYGGPTQAFVAEQLDRRRQSLIAQIAGTRERSKVERAALATRKSLLQDELTNIHNALVAQRARLTIAVASLERYTRIRALGLLSEEQWSTKRAELLDQRARVDSLEREHAAGKTLVAEVEARVATLDPDYAGEIAELERGLANTELEMAENDARRAIVLVAPLAGVVTGIAANLGQPVALGQELAVIVPSEPVLHAELYAPSRAVGFVAPGAEVELRYAAFPYQKFGHARGRVVSISKAGLTASDPRGTPLGEAAYRIDVELESQTINAYGQPRPLLPGMAVEADVLLETRRLYEWVLEPLYAL